MASSDAAQIAIASLTDRAKLATLKTKRAANGRLLKCLYWMDNAAERGQSVEALVDSSLSSYSDAPGHRSLVRAALLRNFDIATKLGCRTKSNLDQIRRGRSPIIGRGPYSGQKAEVDHIIPRSHVPQLDKDFANLELLPFALNRAKTNHVTSRQVSLGQRLAEAGVISAAQVHLLRDLADKGRNRPAFSSNSAAVSGRSTGAADPRVIIPKVQSLAEQIEDFEKRLGAALEQSEYSLRQASELVGRVESRAAAVLNRTHEDNIAVKRLRSDLEQWKERMRIALGQARQVLKEAEDVCSKATASVEYWSEKLALAQEWLERATVRESHARTVYHRTQSALNSAQNDLNRAQSALSSARHRTECVGRDKDGNKIYAPIDTSPYEEAVEDAERQVSHWERELEAAEAELSLAVAELEAAEARVHACNQALSLSHQACQIAVQSREIASQAVSVSDHGQEEYSRVEEIAGRAVSKTEEEAKLVANIQAHVAGAKNQLASSQASLNRAFLSHEEARSRACQGKLEIEWRVEQLRAFDAPISGF